MTWEIWGNSVGQHALKIAQKASKGHYPEPNVVYTNAWLVGSLALFSTLSQAEGWYPMVGKLFTNQASSDRQRHRARRPLTFTSSTPRFTQFSCRYCETNPFEAATETPYLARITQVNETQEVTAITTDKKTSPQWHQRQ